jgi:UDP-N-acetylglucosamine 2-epimerase (non-hydrolysing)
MKIMTVVGARPNFMKAAPIIAAIREHNNQARRANAGLSSESPVPMIDHTLVHTGQHYDAAMSDSFFSDLQLPPPDIRLGVGSASHGVQTAEILKRFEKILLTHRPDVVIVVGDVNSTLACSLVTAKISFDSMGTRPLLAHVEAGLRSFDRSMPEEVNRVVTDHVADLLFVTEQSGVMNLRDEGIRADSVHFVGNTMIDSLLSFQEQAEQSTILDDLELRCHVGGNGDGIARYGLLTLHRPSNVDNREVFRSILAGVEELAAQCPVVFPTHPRTQRRIREFGLEGRFNTNLPGMNDIERAVNGRNGIIVVDPLGYLDFLCLMKHAAVVVTDSGGIQEETTCLGIPCVTVRDNTERPVTVERGTNIVAGTTQEKIAAAIRRQMGRTGGNTRPEKWDGQAARRIVEILVAACRNRVPVPDPVMQPCA